VQAKDVDQALPLCPRFETTWNVGGYFGYLGRRFWKGPTTVKGIFDQKING